MKYFTHICMQTSQTQKLRFWPKRPPSAFSVAETSVAEMSGPKRPRPKCPWPKCPSTILYIRTPFSGILDPHLKKHIGKHERGFLELRNKTSKIAFLAVSKFARLQPMPLPRSHPRPMADINIECVVEQSMDGKME